METSISTTRQSSKVIIPGEYSLNVTDVPLNRRHTSAANFNLNPKWKSENFPAGSSPF